MNETKTANKSEQESEKKAQMTMTRQFNFKEPTNNKRGARQLIKNALYSSPTI